MFCLRFFVPPHYGKLEHDANILTFVIKTQNMDTILL